MGEESGVRGWIQTALFGQAAQLIQCGDEFHVEEAECLGTNSVKKERRVGPIRPDASSPFIPRPHGKTRAAFEA